MMILAKICETCGQPISGEPRVLGVMLVMVICFGMGTLAGWQLYRWYHGTEDK